MFFPELCGIPVNNYTEKCKITPSHKASSNKNKVMMESNRILTYHHISEESGTQPTSN